jgi:alpha-L-rhamnosidase
MHVTGLRCEHLVDPLGIGITRPRLSWRTETAVRAWRQAAYEVEAVDDDTEAILWSSDRVDGDDSVLVAWGGSNLRARQRCRWRVRVWAEDGPASSWSSWASFELGLLDPDDWIGVFVTPDPDDGGAIEERPAPFLRDEFVVDREFSRARLYVTAIGCYEVVLNGQTVGDDVLAPGWSSYRHRLRYRTHDVTDLVRQGPNALGAVLADGWARGWLGWDGGRAKYTDRLALVAQLEVVHPDGSATVVATDATWRWTTGPIRSADLYMGEQYDARLELEGWAEPGFDDRAWGPVAPFPWDRATLVAPTGPPVRRIEEIEPVAVAIAPSGELVVDFGQNLVGRVRIHVQGPAGGTVVLRHAEVLQDGELAVGPLRRARATDEYTLRGDASGEVWEPRFTFHGFRYLGVSGWPGPFDPRAVTAVVLHSDMERTGWFECSDPLVQRLHENIVWGMRGNFLDVPTDCPQRDERLGWTGDLQVFAPTGTLLYDVAGVLDEWLADLAVDQRDDGAVPQTVPFEGTAMIAAAGWSDAATVVPTTLHQAYGDTGILARQYESMRAWVDHVHRRVGHSMRWTGDFQFGDWLDPSAPSGRPDAARTDRDLLATAYFAHSARLVADAAHMLGRSRDADRYRELAAQIAAAFRAEYVTRNGRIVSDAPTAYAVALTFDLLLPDQRAGAGNRLAELVRGEGCRIGTGFLGTPVVNPALTEAGHDDVAYALLTQPRCPSWLYPVLHGATTIWERWDSLLPDGTINPSGMTSFNHYAFGSVGAWLYHSVAGLRPGAPGWRHLVVRPVPGGGLTSASGTVHTPYGTASSRWHLDEDVLELTVVVPPNCTATVSVPGPADGPVEVGSGTHSWRGEVTQELLARWRQRSTDARYGLGTTLRELAGDQAAMGVFIEHAARIFGVVEDPMALSDLSVAEILDRTGVLGEDEIVALESALAAL